MFINVIFMFVMGTMAIAGALTAFRRRRIILDTPKSKIRSAAQGKIEIHGFAWSQQAHLNLHKQPCVFLDLALNRYEGGNDDSWRRVFNLDFSGDGFIVADETGAAWVEVSAHGEKELAASTEVKTSSNLSFGNYMSFHRKNMSLQLHCEELNWVDLTAEQRNTFCEWATRANKTMPPNLDKGRYQIVIHQIRLGSPLTVSGFFDTEKVFSTSVIPGFVEFQKKYQEFARNPSLLLQKIDVNNDGVVDSDEYRMYLEQLAKISHQKISLQEAAQIASGESTPLLGIIRGKDHCVLMVANDNEAGQVKKLANIGYLLLSLAVIIYSLGVIGLHQILYPSAH